MRSVGLCAVGVILVAGAVHAGLAKPRRGFQVKVGEFTVDPAEDLEMCEYRRLPNRKAIDVNGFRLRMPAGAHHFVVWSYGGSVQDDSMFPDEPRESVGCAGVAPDELIPQVLVPIQEPNSRFRFPKGIALRLEPHKQVWLNPHMKNFGTEPLKPDIRFNFYRARKGTVRHYAEGLIVGNMAAIEIPAGGTQTITAEWTAPVDLNVIQLATHQHRLGTYANIELVEPDGVTPRLIYENTNWQHPPSYWPEEPIRLAKGRKVRITCTWQNTDDHPVRFGPETTDEMCFILGFYYRDEGDTAPVVGGGCVPAKQGLLCPLAPAVVH
jgi:hypothetical protein